MSVFKNERGDALVSFQLDFGTWQVAQRWLGEQLRSVENSARFVGETPEAHSAEYTALKKLYDELTGEVFARAGR